MGKIKKYLAVLSALYVAGLACFQLLLYFWLFAKGAVWISDNVLPFFRTLSNDTLLTSLVVLLPLSFFRRTRVLAAYGMVVASFIVALNLWAWSFLQAYVVMQVPASFVGRFIFGVFAVPVAITGALFQGGWSTLGELLFLSFFVSVLLFPGIWLLKNVRSSGP